VRNAPSPAATASLAIGKVIGDMAVENFHLKLPTADTDVTLTSPARYLRKQAV